MEHFQHIDLLQPGAPARLVFAAYAWVLDRDFWIWACASCAAADVLCGLCLAFARRCWLGRLTSAGRWTGAALLFAMREPAMRWLERPTFGFVPWQAWLVLLVGQWLIGVVLIAGVVASLFGGSSQSRVISGRRRDQ